MSLFVFTVDVNVRVRPIPVLGIGYFPILTGKGGYRYRPILMCDTSSPVVHLPVSTVYTVATHVYSFKAIPYFRTYTPHTYITCTHLCPTQNRIFGTENLYSLLSVLV